MKTKTMKIKLFKNTIKYSVMGVDVEIDIYSANKSAVTDISETIKTLGQRDGGISQEFKTYESEVKK